MLREVTVRTPRIFVSYTGQDLNAFADVVRDVLLRLEWTAVDHRNWGSTGRPSVQECYERVRGSDVVVVLVAHRYGWVPSPEEGGDGVSSITRLEVMWALAAGKPVLPYVLEDGANWPVKHVQELPGSGGPLDRFKAELRQTVVGFFRDDPDSLRLSLSEDLRRAWDRVLAGRVDTPPSLGGPAATAVPATDLPYLCNRDVQEDAIDEALRAHLAHPVRRPLVLVLHGPANESHRAFVDRLAADFVPRVLRLRGFSGRLKFLKIERQVMGRRPEEFASHLRRLIAGELQIDEPPGDAALVGAVQAMRLGGIVPVLTLLAEEYTAAADVPLEHLRHYWETFPDVPSPLLVLAIVCVKYRTETGMFSGWRIPFWRRRPRDGDPLRTAVDASRSYRSDRVGWYVLPELLQVRLADLDRWANKVSRVARDLSHTGLRGVLGPKESLPMDEVAPKLRALLGSPSRP